MEDKKVGIFAPWVIFAAEVEALFGDDPEVHVDYDAEATKLSVRVDNPTKAEAIQALLGEKREFGDVTLEIDVIPANAGEDVASLFRLAFAGNPLFSRVEEVDSFGFQATYALFEPKVVQYPDDSLQSVYGVRTCAVEDVAKDVIGVGAGAFICSDLAE